MSTDAHFWVKISHKLGQNFKHFGSWPLPPQFFQVNSNTDNNINKTTLVQSPVQHSARKWEGFILQHSRAHTGTPESGTRMSTVLQAVWAKTSAYSRTCNDMRSAQPWSWAQRVKKISHCHSHSTAGPYVVWISTVSVWLICRNVRTADSGSDPHACVLKSADWQRIDEFAPQKHCGRKLTRICIVMYFNKSCDKRT